MDLLAVYKGLQPVLRPFGTPYALLMEARRALYGKRKLRSYRPACPCVSVGNISWGGTGKTPFVAWLLRWAEARDLTAVVLSRGYGGKPGKEPLLVESGTLPERAGDEPLMLAREFPKARILVFPRRAEAARFAEAYLKPDLIILDDGMQHLKVRRDTDIVLLRREDLEEDWGRVIPSGVWREGAKALSAAAAFAVKASPEEAHAISALACRRLCSFNRPVFSFFPEPLGLRQLFSGNGGEAYVPPAEYKDSPYILLSGVGNPASVEKTASGFIGRSPVQHFHFADHHPYTGSELQAVLKMAAAPLPVVCTPKDAVKLRAFPGIFSNVPVWVLETRLVFGPSLLTDVEFPSWWEQRWEQMRTAHGQKTDTPLS